MDSTLWDSFSAATDVFASSNSTLLGLNNSSIRTTKHLNSIWDNLRTGIIQAAKTHISHFQVRPTSSERIPKPITTLQLRIKSLNRIYYQFRASLLNQQLWLNNDRWQDLKTALSNILAQMPTYPPTSFVSFLTQENVWSEKKKIHHML